MQHSRTSSPVPDSLSDAFSTPSDVIDARDNRTENEFASLGLDRKYPAVVAHLRERQEFYRKYLPDGTAITGLSNEEVGAWWKCAATLIAELEALITIIEVSRDAVRQS
jgi:hypothetical protein